MPQVLGLRRRSLAFQVLLLVLVLVLLVVVSGLALSLVDAQRDQRRQAEQIAVAVATSVADTPTVVDTVAGPDPTAVLQPWAERVRRDTHTDFVVIMSVGGQRFTHPDPRQIGGRYLGSIDQAAQGQTYVEQYTGTLGPSVRAVVPVRRGSSVVALVAVGITTANVQRSLAPSLVVVGVTSVGTLLAAAVGAWLIGRRLARQTQGMAAAELADMVDYYDAVLHSVREGLLLLDGHGAIRLANDEAIRLLGLPPEAVGLAVTSVGLPEQMVTRLRGGRTVEDDIVVVGDTALVMNLTPAVRDGRTLGSVVTLRDRTDLQQVTGELAAVRGFADSLRSQNHESANRLHTVVSLVELGRVDQALSFATRELELAQRLADQVVAAVDDPVLEALLLGKTAQATERGVRLTVDPSSEVSAHGFDPHEMVTILGNLIDNAIDAVGSNADLDQAREVDVFVCIAGPSLELRVADSGPGLTEPQRLRVFERGWSTKPAHGSLARGIGLALVSATVSRLGGRIDVGVSRWGGAQFDVRVAGPPMARGDQT